MLAQLKVLQQYDTFADLAMTGEKNLEVRRNTLGFQKGDRIRYEVVERRWPHDPVDHPLNDATFEVTHVISNRGCRKATSRSASRESAKTYYRKGESP